MATHKCLLGFVLSTCMRKSFLQSAFRINYVILMTGAAAEAIQLFRHVLRIFMGTYIQDPCWLRFPAAWKRPLERKTFLTNPLQYSTIKNHFFFFLSSYDGILWAFIFFLCKDPVWVLQ